MIDRLIMFLEKEMDQRNNALLHGIVSDYIIYRNIVAEYRTLDMVREMVKKYIAEEEGDDEGMSELK